MSARNHEGNKTTKTLERKGKYCRTGLGKKTAAIVFQRPD